jgi:hypothetical protein
MPVLGARPAAPEVVLIMRMVPGGDDFDVNSSRGRRWYVKMKGPNTFVAHCYNRRRESVVVLDKK